MREITFLSLYEYFVSHINEISKLSLEHIYLVIVPVLIAMCVAIPLGILLTRKESISHPILGIIGAIETIPGLALLIFMIPLFGLGNRPAIVALFLYSLLPILRNTYAGIKGVSQGLLEAGKGMGMTGFQLLTYVELPIAFPVIMAGIRTAIVVIIGWATLAAFIGGGGLGVLIVSGLGMSNMRRVLSGAIPAAIMAIIAEYLLEYLEKIITPKGLRINKR